jgi:hypothetical protein
MDPSLSRRERCGQLNRDQVIAQRRRVVIVAAERLLATAV